MGGAIGAERPLCLETNDENLGGAGDEGVGTMDARGENVPRAENAACVRGRLLRLPPLVLLLLALALPGACASNHQPDLLATIPGMVELMASPLDRVLFTADGKPAPLGIYDPSGWQTQA
jgi:hypothetical protein